MQRIIIKEFMPQIERSAVFLLSSVTDVKSFAIDRYTYWVYSIRYQIVALKSEYNCNFAHKKIQKMKEGEKWQNRNITLYRQGFV